MRALRHALRRAAACAAPLPPALHAASAPPLPQLHAFSGAAAPTHEAAAWLLRALHPGAAGGTHAAEAAAASAQPLAPLRRGVASARAPPAGGYCSGASAHRGFAAVPAAAAAPEEQPVAADADADAAAATRGWEPPLPGGAPALDAVPIDHVINVQAFYIAQRIDLCALAKQYGHLPMAQHRDSLIVSLSAGSSRVFPYVAVSGFGSVVLYDLSEAEQLSFLAAARGAAVKLLPAPFSDTLALRVQPSLGAWSRLHADELSLRALDANNLRVVSSVLAQSVALAHFEAKVDAMLELFGRLNREMEVAGRLPLPKRRLFQLVAENNSILTDVITKLGLLSRSDAAWAAARYAEVWEGLRADFDLDDRFENLHFKLDLVATQLRFHMDVLQNRKSDALEWTIIVLICAEVGLGLYDIVTRV